MNNRATKSKYHNKLNGDTILIVSMLALLLGVEGFIIYRGFSSKSGILLLVTSTFT